MKKVLGVLIAVLISVAKENLGDIRDTVANSKSRFVCAFLRILIPLYVRDQASVPVIARTAPFKLIVRRKALHSTASWFSSCVQTKRPDDNDSSLDLRLRVSKSVSSKTSSKVCPPRLDTMGSANATTKQNVEIPDIEDIHRHAILQKQSTYIDPTTGFTAFTELAHLKRGKCCGNQCRHCPYGWSNVRGATNNDDNARAVSGDREETGRLVKCILDGTYYEDEGRSNEATRRVLAMGTGTAASDTDTDESDSDTDESDTETDESTDSKDSTESSKSSQRHVVKGEGKGGCAGGTYTSKNVPYTRKGDKGTAQLFTGERRSKDDVLFEAMGTIDELCSIVGVVYADLSKSNGLMESPRAVDAAPVKSGPVAINSAYGDLPEQLLDVMSRLFDVGSYIAKPVPKEEQMKTSSNGNKRTRFNSNHTALLEEWIDNMTEELPELTSFILPTGSPASAQLHVARTVCRRAERRMVGACDPVLMAYVNRLSDYFFTAARFVNYCDDIDEVQYRSEAVGLNGKGGKDVAFQRERVVVKLKK